MNSINIPPVPGSKHIYRYPSYKHTAATRLKSFTTSYLVYTYHHFAAHNRYDDLPTIIIALGCDSGTVKYESRRDGMFIESSMNK